MELKVVAMTIPAKCNLILGQTHFIKTVEDLYEIMVGISSQVKFGIAFCEASGSCLGVAEKVMKLSRCKTPTSDFFVCNCMKIIIRSATSNIEERQEFLRKITIRIGYF